jgi:hypothetical protein
MSTFTISKNLEQVPRGGDVGTWDTPTNSNWGIVDAALGQIAVIGLNNSNIVLAPSQYQCNNIIFNSTLTGSVVVTFPSTFTGPYIIQNLCTGTSAFTITLNTTAVGGQVIGCPQGDSFNMINDGSNLRFHNFGRVGSYWDYAGSSIPNWLSACSLPPYLNCDGSTFSPTAYPALNTILGGNTLPDTRGRFRAILNQGTARITTASGGLDGNTLLASGGIPTNTLVTANLPPYTPTGTLSINPLNFGLSPNLASGNIQSVSVTPTAITGTFNGNPQGGTSTPFGNVPPAYVGGLTFIRAA